jgi:sigma-B regulation protein RsbU (phosphoserine phosphatase)
MELEKSLELAMHVQQSLLPQCTPKVCGLEISSHTRYCDATGGDYLDFIDVAGLSDDRAFIAVGDVSGHGVGAALLMASARAAVRTSAAIGNESLGHLMGRVNDVLARDARHGMFMSMLLLVIEPQDHRVRWASAGHDPAVVYDPAKDEFHELSGADILLGLEEGLTYANFSFTALRPGTILFVGTDGLWEAHNPRGEMFGKERMREVLRAHAAGTADHIVAAMERALGAFVENRPVHDDVTFVAVKMAAVSTAGSMDSHSPAHFAAGER